MSIHRKILSNSWKTIWKNKYFWFFGLFASILMGEGMIEILSNAFSGGTSRDFLKGFYQYSETGIFRGDILARIGEIIMHETLTAFVFAFIFLLMLVLSGFVFWLAIVSQIAIINNSAKITGGKNTNFQDGINTGIGKFWSVLGVDVSFKILSFVILFIVSLPMLFVEFGSGSFVINLISTLFFIIFVPLAVSIFFITKYAICFVVIKDEKFKKAILNAIKFFRKNWLISLEMAFLLFVIGFFVTFFIVLGVLVIAVPFAFLVYFTIELGSILFFWILFGIFLLISFVIIVLAGSIFTSFQVSVITNIFIELLNKGGQSKLSRVFDKN